MTNLEIFLYCLVSLTDNGQIVIKLHMIVRNVIIFLKFNQILDVKFNQYYKFLPENLHLIEGEFTKKKNS